MYLPYLATDSSLADNQFGDDGAMAIASLASSLPRLEVLGYVPRNLFRS
jgi:hypothetical protein